MVKQQLPEQLPALFENVAVALGLKGKAKKREKSGLMRETNKIFPNLQKSQITELIKAADIFRSLVLLGISPYDSRANRQRIWGIISAASLGKTVNFWQFICPPKITLEKDGWIVEDDPRYDIFEKNLKETAELIDLIRSLDFQFWLFLADDEILKARASGISLSNISTEKANQLKEQLNVIFKTEKIESQRKADIVLGSGVGKVVLWTEIASKFGFDVDKLFGDELYFWREQGKKGVGFFVETQKMLVRNFGLDPEIADELTARRLAKYAVEGKIIADMFPQGSIYLNNEFPFKEPWAMFTASLTPKQRDKMAVLFYLKNS